MKLSEILRAGKQRLETLGWVQGDENVYLAHSIKCCAATALLPIDKWDWPAAGEACRFLERTNGIETGGISFWNDSPTRTLPEVLTAYDKAIAAAEAQESHHE